MQTNGTHSHPKIALLTEYHVDYSYSKRNLDNITELLERSYDLYPIMVRKNQWTYIGDKGPQVEVDKNDFSIKLNEKKITFDAVLNIIDDTTGENANIQGYLEMLKIPSPNPGMLSTAVAFNKLMTNGIASFLDVVKVAKSIQVRRNVPYDIDDIKKRIKFPVIVKPTEGSNSYMVTKVNSIDELPQVLKNIFTTFPKLLIEEFITGREITCAAYKSKGIVKIIGITERKSLITDFIDYETKHKDLYTQITPADVSKEVVEKVEQVIQTIYTEFGYSGVVRFDFILENGTNELHFLEVNSYPVLSRQSVIGKQAVAAGISLKQILCEIIEECLEESKIKKLHGT